MKSTFCPGVSNCWFESCPSLERSRKIERIASIDKCWHSSPIRLLPLRYTGCDITSKNKVATNCSRSKIGFDAIFVFNQAHDRKLG